MVMSSTGLILVVVTAVAFWILRPERRRRAPVRVVDRLRDRDHQVDPRPDVDVARDEFLDAFGRHLQRAGEEGRRDVDQHQPEGDEEDPLAFLDLPRLRGLVESHRNGRTRHVADPVEVAREKGVKVPMLDRGRS